MPHARHVLFALLPKVALSRLTGLATRIPLPRACRAPLLGAFARRYGVALDELDRDLRAFRSFQDFFTRPLAPGARPLATAAPPLAPCDGAVIQCGAVAADTTLLVKGNPQRVDELLDDDAGPNRFAGGSVCAVYLAPGDYHRVHTPFAGRVDAIRRLPGTLYPVNVPAQRAIPRLFARNARTVFEFTLDDGRPGAVVMIGAFNVGDIRPSVAVGARLTAGAELGRFGFGSSVVALIAPGGASFGARDAGARVLQGESLA